MVATTTFAERGRVTGLWTASFFFGQFLTPILIGILAAALGGLTTAVGVVGVAAVVVAIATFVATRRPEAALDATEDVHARETA